MPDFNGGLTPAHLDADSDLDGGYDAVGVESDIGDNLEILDCDNGNKESWGHTRAMPPKKYFKEDDDDFEFYEERADKGRKQKFSRQPSEGVQHYHRGGQGPHQSAGAGQFMMNQPMQHPFAQTYGHGMSMVGPMVPGTAPAP